MTLALLLAGMHGCVRWAGVDDSAGGAAEPQAGAWVAFARAAAEHLPVPPPLRLAWRAAWQWAAAGAAADTIAAPAAAPLLFRGRLLQAFPLHSGPCVRLVLAPSALVGGPGVSPPRAGPRGLNPVGAAEMMSSLASYNAVTLFSLMKAIRSGGAPPGVHIVDAARVVAGPPPDASSGGPVAAMLGGDLPLAGDDIRLPGGVLEVGQHGHRCLFV